eukprot:Rhum_TRINITY_DN15061_c12_g1::Rhum_TRINITY_DN15061_c12_g1_i1::g.133623::m.133623
MTLQQSPSKMPCLSNEAEEAIERIQREIATLWNCDDKKRQRLVARPSSSNPFIIRQGPVSRLLDSLQAVREGSAAAISATYGYADADVAATQPMAESPAAAPVRRRVVSPRVSPRVSVTPRSPVDESLQLPQGRRGTGGERTEEEVRPWRSKPDGFVRRPSVNSHLRTMDGKLVPNPQSPIQVVWKCRKSHVMLGFVSGGARESDAFLVGGATQACSECKEGQPVLQCTECGPPYYLCDACKTHSEWGRERRGSQYSANGDGSARASRASSVARLGSGPLARSGSSGLRYGGSAAQLRGRSRSCGERCTSEDRADSQVQSTAEPGAPGISSRELRRMTLQNIPDVVSQCSDDDGDGDGGGDNCEGEEEVSSPEAVAAQGQQGIRSASPNLSETQYSLASEGGGDHRWST